MKTKTAYVELQRQFFIFFIFFTACSEDKDSIRRAAAPVFYFFYFFLQLVAKTKTAYVELQRQFAKRLIEKEYHALVEGCVDGEKVKGSRD